MLKAEFVSVCAVIQLLVAMTLRLIWWKSQQYPGPMQRRVQQYSHSPKILRSLEISVPRPATEREDASTH